MIAPNQSPLETSLQRELRLLREGLARLLNVILDRLFDLNPESAKRRRQYFIFLFFVSGFIISVRNEDYSIGHWIAHLQDILLYLFTRAYFNSYIGDPFTKTIIFGWQAFTFPRTLQYLPILLASFFIALQSAALYLADVFELDNVSIARKFIEQVALTGSNDTIRVANGNITTEHMDSSVFKIGGPGKVIVDIDSVALFEKPDGSPNIIGPTADRPGGKALLDGFERLRHTIDLRDHYSEPLTVSGRSLDGIKISAVDIKFVYSIFRDHDDQKPTKERPYTFSDVAVKKLVYGYTSKVTKPGNFSTSPSSPMLLWLPNILSLVKGELSNLIGGHKLTEYLASFGSPEFEKAKARETEIARQAEEMMPAYEPKPTPHPIPQPPDFKSRHEITKLFSEIEKDFQKKSLERGVNLHWIGVGTWQTPIEIVSKKHLEAWLLSRENLTLGSDDALKNLGEKTIQQKMTTLIRVVPIESYYKEIKEHDHKGAMRSMLIAYRQQLIEAVEFIRHKNPEILLINIEEAIKLTEIALGIKHWVRPSFPTKSSVDKRSAPSTSQSTVSAEKDNEQGFHPTTDHSNASEQDLYENLLLKSQGDKEKAERLIEAEHKKTPNASRGELIERAILSWEKDNR